MLNTVAEVTVEGPETALTKFCAENVFALLQVCANITPASGTC